MYDGKQSDRSLQMQMMEAGPLTMSPVEARMSTAIKLQLQRPHSLDSAPLPQL
jgi:hypothetical protein